MSYPSYQTKRHVAIIESARGFAALYVVVSHIVEMLHLPTLHPANSIFTIVIDLLMIYGDQAVLLFFVLSGFSIHYASADRNLSDRHGLLNYYYLRWRRIYPIFIIALLLGYIADLVASALAPVRYNALMQDFDLDELLFTLLFMTDRPYIDGVIMPVIRGNTPLWSLSYEVFYYLIYPAYWYANRKWGFICAATGGLIVSLLAFALGKIGGGKSFP